MDGTTNPEFIVNRYRRRFPTVFLCHLLNLLEKCVGA